MRAAIYQHDPSKISTYEKVHFVNEIRCETFARQRAGGTRGRLGAHVLCRDGGRRWEAPHHLLWGAPGRSGLFHKCLSLMDHVDKLPLSSGTGFLNTTG